MLRGLSAGEGPPRRTLARGRVARARTLARAAVLGAVLALAAAGCGGSSAGPRTVALSLLAPTDGSTVNVRSLVVIGKVDPPSAAVRVGGRRVAVAHGTFKQPLYLRGKAQRIAVSASARGYLAARLEATVHYRAPPRSAGGSGGGSGGIATSAGIISSAAIARSSGATSSSSTPQLPASGSGPGFRTPQGRQAFLTACEAGPGGSPALCGCVYGKLAASPELRTPAQQYAFAKQTVDAAVAGNAGALPAVARTSIEQCIAKVGIG